MCTSYREPNLCIYFFLIKNTTYLPHPSKRRVMNITKEKYVRKPQFKATTVLSILQRKCSNPSSEEPSPSNALTPASHKKLKCCEVINSCYISNMEPGKSLETLRNWIFETGQNYHENKIVTGHYIGLKTSRQVSQTFVEVRSLSVGFYDILILSPNKKKKKKRGRKDVKVSIKIEGNKPSPVSILLNKGAASAPKKPRAGLQEMR